MPDDFQFGQQIGTTPYVETVKEPVSPEMEFRDDGTTVTRTYLIPWTSYRQVAADVLGYPEIETKHARQYISRNLPDAFPELANSLGNPYLFATAIKSVQGLGVPDGGNMQSQSDVAVYKYARVSVVYETLTYEILSDKQMVNAGLVDRWGNPDESTLRRYVTKVIKPSAEYLSLPQGSFQYVVASAPAGLAVIGQPGKITPVYDMSLTWHHVPREAIGSLLYNAGLTTPVLDQAIGKVNVKPFAGCMAGTLLCMPPDIRPIRSPLGDRIYDVEYRFKWLNLGTVPVGIFGAGDPIGHNHLYAGKPQLNNAHAGGYYEVTGGLASGAFAGPGTTNIKINPATGANTFGVDGANIYDWCDFAPLFQVPS